MMPIEVLISFFKTILSMGRDFVMWEYGGFKLFEQLLIPIVSGGIGGLALVVMASLNYNGVLITKKIWNIYAKFAFLGSIAGVAAVNLLNPNGDISQVMVLGLVAGLSGFSYLKRTALVDSIQEDLVFKSIKEDAVDTAEEFVGSSTESDMEIAEGMDSDNEDTIFEMKGSKLKRYVDKKLAEWIEENPDAEEEEFIDYYNELIEEVMIAPEIVDLDE